MSNVLAGILATLVFALVLSVWNLLTKNLPGSVGGGIDWIVLLIAAIAAIVVFLKTSNQDGNL